MQMKSLIRHSCLVTCDLVRREDTLLSASLFDYLLSRSISLLMENVSSPMATDSRIS